MAAVVVVGGGVAGLTAAVSALEAGAARVTLLEREAKLGGNSAKASYGINAVGPGDSAEAFAEDILASAGGAGDAADPALVRRLAEASGDAKAWLESLGVKFEEVVQGAGSRAPRLHRAMGFMLVASLGKRLEQFVSEGRASIVKEAKATGLLAGGAGVFGVKYEHGGGEVEARGAVILSSGGFSANPEMVGEGRASMPITQGPWTMGEGQHMAEAVGAKIVGAGDVQVHPTGFVDPKDRAARSAILASESLRQAGAVLINGAGRRFCDERGDVASEIVSKLGGAGQPQPIRLVLPPKTVESEAKHVGFYVSKGLIKKYDTVAEMAAEAGLDAAAVAESLGLSAASEGPVMSGEVAPAVHYSLGGVKIDENAQAIGADAAIAGLYAAGEAAGGIHGRNRLAGNGLLESVVFGRLAGKNAAERGPAAC